MPGMHDTPPADAKLTTATVGNLATITQWVQSYTTRLYRVTMLDSDKVSVESVSPLAKEVPPYEGMLGDFPNWVADRVAALSIMPVPPPPIEIDDVGMRISEDTYWVIAPEG